MKVTYANVVATLALVVAAAGGGTAVAASVAKNSVGTAQLKKNAVTAAKVKNGSIGGRDVKNSSLGGADIADHSLGGQDIARGSVGGDDLAAGTIGSREIADNSISSDDISDHTITSDDLSPEAINSSNIGPSTILGSNIAPNTITEGNLDPAAVQALTHTWDTDPIAAGSTLTGYSSIAYVASLTKDNAIVPAGTDGAEPEVRALSVSFPVPVTGIVGVEAGGSAHCTGTFDDPTSTGGIACFYLRADPSGSNHVGTASLLDYSKFGFALGYQPPASGWTFAQISWAFTRPSS